MLDSHFFFLRWDPLMQSPDTAPLFTSCSVAPGGLLGASLPDDSLYKRRRSNFPSGFFRSYVCNCSFSAFYEGPLHLHLTLVRFDCSHFSVLILGMRRPFAIEYWEASSTFPERRCVFPLEVFSKFRWLQVQLVLSAHSICFSLTHWYRTKSWIGSQYSSVDELSNSGNQSSCDGIICIPYRSGQIFLLKVINFPKELFLGR